MKQLRTMLGLVIVLPLLSGAAFATGPTTVGLKLWLKADAGLAADGSTWVDQSGHNHTATAPEGEAPTVVSDGLNGLPVAEFSGGQSLEISGAILTSQQFTILAVVTDTGASGHGFQEILSNWNDKTTVSSVFLGTTESAVNGQEVDRFRFTDAIGGADQGQAGQGTIPKPADGFVLSGVSAATDAQVYLNTKLAYDLGSALSARELHKPWYIGRQGQYDGESWTGDIAEILVYDKALTAPELHRDIIYLKDKWLVAPKP